jgi:GNAT superfamily N-acetyltransferase
VVELKLCSEADINEIRTVAIQSYKEHYLYLWTEYRFAEWYMDRSFSTACLAEQMKDEKALFYLVVVNKKTAGFIKLNKNKPLPGDVAGKSLELERIYLLKEVSGKGIGTQVLNEVINYCKQQGINILWLKSMDSSDSLFFYQKRGFKIIATERLPFEGFKDEYRNLVTMRFLINE